MALQPDRPTPGLARLPYVCLGPAYFFRSTTQRIWYMNWFLYSLTAILFWSGSDLFSKIGSRADDTYSHWKMVMAVGTVMGLHAIYLVATGTPFSPIDILTYLPASALYILSMIVGYAGLRYIELSISSPICNSSGALVAILTLITAGLGDMGALQLIAITLVAGGVILLGVVEATEDDELRAARQEAGNRKYAKSFLALLLPILYCVLDAAGTCADSLVLETLDEGSANVAYELTFLVAGLLAGGYVLFVKREKLTVRSEGPKYLGAVCETIGQFFYIYALADKAHVAMSAPIIASYCAVSVLWSRLFLKEKLSWKHYAAIAITVAGIAIIGLLDP